MDVCTALLIFCPMFGSVSPNQRAQHYGVKYKVRFESHGHADPTMHLYLEYAGWMILTYRCRTSHRYGNPK